MEFSNSKLVTYTNLTSKHSGTRKYPITKIAIHHMAGVMTAKQCVDYFKTTKRQVSSNYCIGYDGSIGMSVEEKNRAWTTSSEWCDQRAVTIEVSNDKKGDPWTISAKSYRALVELVLDIAKRNGLSKISYTGGKGGTLQKHEWYANTNCPGPYLGGKFADIVKETNVRLKGKKYEPQKKTKKQTPKLDGELYRVSVAILNIREKPTATSKIVGAIKDRGTYTIVEKKGSWGKLKSGAGWISLIYCTSINTGKSKEKPKSDEELALDIALGRNCWKGVTGYARKVKLEWLGKDYDKIQALVNRIVKNGYKL